MFMSTAEIRSEIDRYLDLVKDERFLKVVHSMLGTYIEEKKKEPIISYDIDGTPRTAEELEAILNKEVEAGRRGEYTTLEELRKESDEWLESIQ